VEIDATGRRLRVGVIDDGAGIGEATRRSGLANLRRRAERAGGSMTVASPQEGGTRLTWTIPLT
jgi:signal transduction histidine kinase